MNCPVCGGMHWRWFDATWGYCSPVAACCCIYPCGDMLCPALPFTDDLDDDDYLGNDE